MKTIVLWSGALVVVVAMLGSSTTSSLSPQVSTQQASVPNLATEVCNKLQACYPYAVTITYGSVTTCVSRARNQLRCLVDRDRKHGHRRRRRGMRPGLRRHELQRPAGQPGAGGVPDSWEPSARHPMRQRPAVRGEQRILQGIDRDVRRVLDAPGRRGRVHRERRLPARKSRMQRVPGTTGSCVTPGAQGSACSATLPCQGPLVCVNGSCGTAPGAGESVHRHPGRLRPDHRGYYCSAAALCTQVHTATAGESCGISTSGITVCAPGTCQTAPGTTTGTCEAPAADGAACNADTGPGMPRASHLRQRLVHVREPGGLQLGYAAAAAGRVGPATGSSIVKLVSTLGVLSTRTVPPWAPTILRTR